MQYQSKTISEKNLNKVTGGGLIYCDRKPEAEGEVGVYYENLTWVVAHVRPGGEFFEFGYYDTKEIAKEEAENYINCLKKYF